MSHKKLQIGFIGQGWIGKHYADDFEARGYQTIRFSLEEPYNNNKKLIGSCPITFIAVPTPTTPNGFDGSILRDALGNIKSGNIAVIKSTTIPGFTKQLQAEFGDIILLHSPEFLVEKTAAYDAANPKRTIVGLPVESETHRKAAETVLEILPVAPYTKVMSSTESELVKYAGNCFLYTKVLFMNALVDVVNNCEANFEIIREAMIMDDRIGSSHTYPIHDSGRGAGGHCFIKDFEIFKEYYKELNGSDAAYTMLTAMSEYNTHLLKASNKDLDLLSGVYGEEVLK